MAQFIKIDIFLILCQNNEKGAIMLDHHIIIGKGGRLVIPSGYRKALGLHEGDTIVIRLLDGEIRLFQQQHALNNIRKAIRAQNKETNLTDEFLAFRKKDAGKE